MSRLFARMNLSQKLILGLSVLVIAVCSSGGWWGFLLGVGLAGMGLLRSWPTNDDANAQIVCPHCQVRGGVLTWKLTVKDGIDGGKATAGILTGGLSLLATGLSHTSRVLGARCVNCGMRWTIR